MSLNHFDLNLLQVFEALVSEAHVSRAAERLCLSQSATSHALNRLRTQLNDPVLVRCGNGLQPTPRALAMLPEVRDILKRLEHTLLQPLAFDPASSERTFRLAVTDYFEAVVLPDMMPALAQEAPGIVIELQMIGPQASLAGLESGATDLVVGLDASASLPAHLIRQHWLREHPACLAGNAFDGIPARLGLDDYLQLPHVVMLDQTDSSTSGVDRWLAAQQQSRRHCAQMINYFAAARYICGKRALLTLPARMARLLSQSLPVRVIDGPDGLPSWDMSLVLHPLHAQDPGIAWLSERIHAAARQL